MEYEIEVVSYERDMEGNILYSPHKDAYQKAVGENEKWFIKINNLDQMNALVASAGQIELDCEQGDIKIILLNDYK